MFINNCELNDKPYDCKVKLFKREIIFDELKENVKKFVVKEM
jgi:hypothetical protein